MKLLETLTHSDPTASGLDDMSGFKEFLRTNKTALKMFLQLIDIYREDGNLNSKDAKGITSDLMSMYMGTESSPLGIAKWEPNQLAFAMFLDEIGNQPVADFLGITSVDEIPNADLESRADEIRNKSLPKTEEPPTPQLSSHSAKRRNPLLEGRVYHRGSFVRHYQAATRKPGKKSNPFA